MKYLIRTKEILVRDFVIEAESQDEAEDKAVHMADEDKDCRQVFSSDIEVHWIGIDLDLDKRVS